MAAESLPYRYRLVLVPDTKPAGERTHPTDGSRSVDGWELVSDRVSDDGSELLVFRRPA